MVGARQDGPAKVGAPSHEQVEEIFLRAAELHHEERRAYLDAAAVAGSELRREVESLLEYLDDESLPALEIPPADFAESEVAHPTRLGAYVLERELGRGGMGVVYLAEDTRLGRKVAIKMLMAFGAGSASLRARLVREAEAASRLDHPALCKVFEIGDADGVPYIVMQYVEGETLARRLSGIARRAPAEAPERRRRATRST